MGKNQKITKSLTILLLGLLLPALVLTSLDAGISGDEYLHLTQAEMVLDYYKTFGKDNSALHTPVTNLKFYGQSFDNFVLLVGNLFDIEDIFTLRHVMNALAGWLTILFTALLAAHVAGWNTSLLAVLLMACTPIFTGHALNNLKDIPFALGYVASLYYMIKWIPRRHNYRLSTWLGLTASLAFIFSIRPGGLLAFAFLWGFTLLALIVENIRKQPLLNFRKTLIELIVITATAWLAGCLFWPYALENLLWHPVQSFLVMSHYPITIRQLFEGALQWSDLMPWYYLPKSMLLTLPLGVILGLILFVIFFPFKVSPRKFNTADPLIVVLIAALFPIFWIIITNANLYGSWRHLLFVLPPLVVIASKGLIFLFQKTNKHIRNTRIIQLSAIAFLVVLLWHPAAFTIQNRPLQYLYFNQMAGSLPNAFGRYEADYYYHTIKPASEWLKNYLIKNGEEKIILASNFETAWYFRNSDTVKQHIYTSYYNKEYHDWDYAIFAAAYLHGRTLNHQYWPPPGTIHTICTDGVPVCAIVKRPSKATFLAIKAMKNNHMEKADSLLRSATQADSLNINTWVQAGKFFLNKGDTNEAVQRLNHALYILPVYEPALLTLSKAQARQGNDRMALGTLNRLLKVNPKYLTAYIEKAEMLLAQNNETQAKEVLKDCLKIKPGYAPAIEKLNSID